MTSPEEHPDALWSAWRAYYETNAARPLPEVAPTAIPDDPELATDLARTFSVFQLGEAGEGRIAKEVLRFEPGTVDDDWRVALGFWVREEGRHGRLLGDCARALGGKPVATNWTNDLLVIGRRVLGIRLKLVFILCAEVIGITFYALVASALDGQLGLQRALRFIAREEAYHHAFHVQFFHRETRSWWRWGLFWLAWWTVGLGGGFVVIVDHRRTLRRLGLSRTRALAAFIGLLHETMQRVRVGGGPVYPADVAAELSWSPAIQRRIEPAA